MKLRDLGLPRYFQLPRSLFAQAYLNMLAFCGFLGALAQARTWDIRMLFEYAFGVFLIPDAARLSREAERRGSSGFKARPSIRALLLGMAILFGSAPNLADAQSFSDCPPIIYAPPVRCIACHNPHIMGGGSISDLPLHFQQSIYLATGTDNVLDADFAIHGMRDLAATSRNAAATGALIVGTPFAPELTIPMIIAIRSGHAGLEYAVTGSEAEAIRCLPFGGIIDAQAQLDTIGSQDASLLDQVSAGVGLIGTATDLWGAGQGIRRCGVALRSRIGARAAQPSSAFCPPQPHELTIFSRCGAKSMTIPADGPFSVPDEFLHFSQDSCMWRFSNRRGQIPGTPPSIEDTALQLIDNPNLLAGRDTYDVTIRAGRLFLLDHRRPIAELLVGRTPTLKLLLDHGMDYKFTAHGQAQWGRIQIEEAPWYRNNGLNCQQRVRYFDLQTRSFIYQRR